jgi:hypothetical protein
MRYLPKILPCSLNYDQLSVMLNHWSCRIRDAAPTGETALVTDRFFPLKDWLRCLGRTVDPPDTCRCGQREEKRNRKKIKEEKGNGTEAFFPDG